MIDLTGLIEEIQRAAIGTDVPVDALLRRTKLAAAKLQLSSLETWVELELNGYPGIDLPDYRKHRGQVAAWNPYNGWIPIQFNNHELADSIRVAYLAEPISSLQDLLRQSDEGEIHYALSPRQIAKLNRMMDFQTARVVVQITRGHIVQAVETVRNMVLEWAIQMEKQGIVGDGLSFNPTEKQQAQQAMTTFHVGSIGQFIGNLGSGNTSGSVTGSQVANSDKLFRELIELARTHIQIADQRDRIISTIEEMQATAGDKKSFAAAYGRFVGNVSNHMTVFGPALSQLAAILA